MGNNSRPSRVVSINQKEGNEITTIEICGLEKQSTQITDTNSNQRALAITCSVENANTVVLIDTGASTNFVSNKFIQSIKNKVRDIEVHPGCLTLKLADNHSITTKGSVNLRVCIPAREMEVPMHIVDNLAYPIILCCDF
jgi:hypothetical protein